MLGGKDHRRALRIEGLLCCIVQDVQSRPMDVSISGSGMGVGCEACGLSSVICGDKFVASCSVVEVRA